MKIEKDIPVEYRRTKYPFHQMKVGDSFYLEGDGRKMQFYIAKAAHHHSKRHGGKFKTKSYDDGARCWRVS